MVLQSILSVLSRVMISLILVFLFFISLVVFSLVYGDDVEEYMFLAYVGREIQDDSNDVELLVPAYDSLDNFNYQKDLDEFHELVIDNYVYDVEKGYECKYWTFIWSMWAYYNVDWDFSVQVVNDNHIFAVLEGGDKYCIADGDVLDCYNLAIENGNN